MEHLLGQDWEIMPAGGATGEAYFARHDEQSLFLKRNSSPFLAVLSAEGIVPKLIWTKRLENGDVITAQQWLEGRELKSVDMKSDDVVRLLKKIHSSEPLLLMLKRLGKDSLQPDTILQKIVNETAHNLYDIPIINNSILFLKAEVMNVQSVNKVVCHCDVNHNNWLLSESNQLYLIDWDGAMIADPAIDLGQLLYSYIPKNEWENWLNQYGLMLTEHLQLRMKWYVIANTLVTIQWYKSKNRIQEMGNNIQFLMEVLAD